MGIKAVEWPDRTLYPFPTRQVVVEGAAMRFAELGSGPAVVLVHGTPTWSLEWRHLLPVLASDHRVLAPDHLGFGLSDRPSDAGYRPEDHARRFGEFMDQTVPAGESVSLVLHDFGGPIALDWVLRNTARVRSLVLVNTWMWSWDDDPGMQRKAKLAGGWLGRWLYRTLNASPRFLLPMGYAQRSRLTPEVHRQYLDAFPDPDSRERVLFALARSMIESRDYLASQWDRRHVLETVPLTLLWGMRDPAFGPAVLRRWRAAFPTATVKEFPDAGHWPHEEDPTAFAVSVQGALGGATRQSTVSDS